MAGIIPPLIPRKRLEEYWEELARLEQQRHVQQPLPTPPAPDEHLENAYEDTISGGVDE